MDVIELMKETPIKGQIHNYDPYNYDDVYADVSDSFSLQFKPRFNEFSNFQEYGGYGTGSGDGFRNGRARGDRFEEKRGGGRGYDRGNNNRGNNIDRGNGRPQQSRDFVDPVRFVNVS